MKAGFTLLETLIAITILILAILGPLTVASNALTSAFYAKDQVTAFYLAQEGIEYMRYLRDYNTLTTASTWDDGIVDCTSANPCGYDPFSTPHLSRNYYNANTTLTIDSGKVYRQDPGIGGTHSNFYRKIWVTHINDNEDKVIVEVKWQTGYIHSPPTFQLTENLFNWQ